MTDNEIIKTAEGENHTSGEKIKAIYPHITISGTVYEPYYSIDWYDIEKQEMHRGYSSFNLQFVHKWLQENFEVVDDDIDNLINRQKAEIERLQKENEILSANADNAFQEGLNESRELFKQEVEAQIKAEAVKEFAERLKDDYIKDKRYDRPNAHTLISFLFDKIDNLCKYWNTNDCGAARMADTILSDGWIRPPCKVGDTVYMPFIESNLKELIPRALPLVVESVALIKHIPEGTIRTKYRTQYISFKFTDFGSKFFHNESEAFAKAEQALAERKDQYENLDLLMREHFHRREQDEARQQQREFRQLERMKAASYAEDCEINQYIESCKDCGFCEMVGETQCEQ